jgi:hypothetical protein
LDKSRPACPVQIPVDFLCPVNDDGAEVRDVGEGRTGPKKIADAIEKPRGIVVGEKRGGIEAGNLRARKRGLVDKCASRVVGAAAATVGAVGVGGLAFPAAGSPMLVLNGPIGWIWALVPAVLAVVALAQPWPGRPVRRP